jgi:ABC-2 type transport system ATP-binding protein
MVEIKNISKFYGNVEALSDISFTVKKGEVVGLLGPNGAGKSTTMKIITGYLIPDSGNVLIDEKNIKKNLISARKKIGYMPENNPLYFDMLVKDYLNYTLSLHDVEKSKRKERLDYVVKTIGLEKVFYRPIGELSKGYKQRVGLAGCIIHDPEILILDEPTEGLDPNQRQEIRKLIKNLGKNKTIIISTHVMQEVEAMCSRLIVINNGEIVLDGNKNEIIKKELETGWISITLEGTSILKSINQLKVTDVEKLDSSKTQTTLRLKTNDRNKFFKDLSQLISKNGWIIYNISMEKYSLEDLFTKLTKDSSKKKIKKTEEESNQKKRKFKVSIKSKN